MSDETPPTPLIEKQAEKPKEDKLQLVNLLADDAALAYVERYKVMRTDEGVLVPLEIAERGVVRTIVKDALVTALTQRYGKMLLPSAIKSELVPALIGRLAMYPLRAEQIRPFRFASDVAGDYAWARLPFDPDQSAQCPPEFKQILDRTSDAEARSLVLWIGSLLDYEGGRTQYLHLSGEGNDGKSTITKLLVQVFGHRTCAEMRAEDFKDTHATTVLEGARLILFHDENNAGFMSSGRFKALTGDEFWTVNPKGQPRRNIVLNCKVLISSNNKPEVHGTKADMRRIVPVYLRSYEGGEDPGFVSRLLAARYQVMQFCYAEWLRHKVAGGKSVPIAEDVKEEVESFSTNNAALAVIERLFEAGDFQELTPAAALNYLRANEPYLAKQAHAVLRKSTVRPGTVRFIKGYRIKPPQKNQ